MTAYIPGTRTHPIAIRPCSNADRCTDFSSRAAVARALAVEPPIVLMDEPFSALDPFTRRELEDEVLRIRSSLKTTFLIVSHNPEAAVYLADRIIVLTPRPGRVAAEIPVPLPFPRDPADMAFLRIREEITRAVLGTT